MTGRPVLQRCSVAESYPLRKHALECLRLEADCVQLAREVRSPALRSHLLRMAKLWPALAERGSIIPGRSIN